MLSVSAELLSRLLALCVGFVPFSFFSVYSCCTFSLLGEKREGVVFSRPLRALRAA